MARLVTLESLETETIQNALFQLKQALSVRTYQIHGNQPAIFDLDEDQIFEDLADLVKAWLTFKGYDYPTFK